MGLRYGRSGLECGDSATHPRPGACGFMPVRPKRKASGAFIGRSRRAAGAILCCTVPADPAMHELSVRLASKRLYIADLAAKLEAMETGQVAMNAVAYRLYARRMKAAMRGYPSTLLAAQLGRACASVLEAIEHRQIELDGFSSGPRGRKAFVAARALLRRLGGDPGRRAP